MKKLFLGLLVVSNMAFGQEMGVIDMSKNFTNRTTITFEQSDNVSETCNAYRKKLGNPTFQQPSRACSFWTKDTCLIITARKVLPESLAHEVYHCIQGHWHK